MKDVPGRNDHMKGGSIVFGSSHLTRRIVIRDGMSFIGICLSVAGLGALGYQCLVWLNYGLWHPLAFRLVLELVGVREPVFGWQWVEQINAWIFDLPLSGALLGASLVVVIFGLAITARGNDLGPHDGSKFVRHSARRS